MADSIRMSGNTIFGRNSAGTQISSSVLTFGTAGVSVSGSLYAAELDAAVLNVNTVSEFTGNSLVLTKAAGTKSYYGTTTDSCEIATIYDVQLASGGNMTTLAASIATEVTRATGAENVLSGSIDTERTRASDAEHVLSGSIDTERTRASDAEHVLSGSIDTERTRASDAEHVLSGSISTEVTRASDAEHVLSGSIDTERTRASDAEHVLSGSISTEVTRASDAEHVLSASISAEVTRATDAESSITARINNILNGTEVCVSLKVTGDVQAGSFTSYSDMRLKTDIEEVANGMETVKALHPVFYNWISGAPSVNPGHKELGFLAQEVEAVLPGVVRTDSSDAFGKKSVAYDRVVSLLVAAVKELDARLAALEPRA